MSWRRSLVISGLALVMVGVWPRVRAQPDAPAAAPTTEAKPKPAEAKPAAKPTPKPAEAKPAAPATGRTTTRLKPQHALADAGFADAAVHTADASVRAGDAGDAGVPTGDASVDAGPPPEPPLDEEALLRELPPAHEKPNPSATTALMAEGPPYGRQRPLMPHVRLDGHVAINWEGGFGVGARVDWLLIEGTFRYRKRDELALTMGADVMFLQFSGSNYTDVYPTIALQWSIGVTDQWFLYPEFGFLGHVQRGEWEGLYPNLGFGARYYIKRSIGIQARFGWPVALSAGAVF